MEHDDFDIVDWSEWESELNALYQFWRVGRPARHNPLDDLIIPDDYLTIAAGGLATFHDDRYPEIKEVFDKVAELEQQWWDEDQGNLKALIELRGCLWT
jgi:hypothetical protein